MYREHRSFIPPDDNTVIWHYASLPKILYLLSSSSLYFCHIGGFEDRDEGKYTRLDKRIIEAVQGSKYSSKQREPFSNRYYVNCWTISETDNLKFWYSYAPGPYGIAIKSSVFRLKTALNLDKEKDVYMAPVRYIDRDNDPSIQNCWESVNIIEKCFAKGELYDWESELRLLHIDNRYNGGEKHKSGIQIKVDLQSLIDEIYLSSNAEQWFTSTICEIINRYGLGDSVVISDALKR